MNESNKPIRIDLTGKTVAETVAFLNAIIQVRHIFDSQGIRIFIRKKKLDKRKSYT